MTIHLNHIGGGALRRTPHLTILLLLILIVVAALPTIAQDSAISDDEVNEVAEKLYCPVCENIPLDVCPTAACKEWREEIRTQLSDGLSEQQVINNFVERYGERVVGTPQDPMLRALSLVTPWILGLLAVLVAGYTFTRWRNGKAQRLAGLGPVPESDKKDDDYYRARVEEDLLARR